jgi:hypothetical protein
MVFINYNNNIKNITLPTTIDGLNRLITEKYDISDFYVIANNKLLTPFNYNYNYTNKDNTIIINSRLNGGVMDILEPIFAPILNPFKDMILAIVDIVSLVLELLKIIPKLIELATSIFSPDKLLNDVIYGSITGLTSMITAIFENLSNLFGDSVPKKEDGTGGVFGIEDKKKAVCIKPSIINLIILIVCPPLALYINKGWRSIFMIIVCGLMTYYMYYFPGFLFAALHILC